MTNQVLIIDKSHPDFHILCGVRPATAGNTATIKHPPVLKHIHIRNLVAKGYIQVTAHGLRVLHRFTSLKKNYPNFTDGIYKVATMNDYSIHLTGPEGPRIPDKKPLSSGASVRVVLNAEAVIRLIATVVSGGKALRDPVEPSIVDLMNRIFNNLTEDKQYILDLDEQLPSGVHIRQQAKGNGVLDALDAYALIKGVPNGDN